MKSNVKLFLIPLICITTMATAPQWNPTVTSYKPLHVEHKISVATKTKSGWVTGGFYGAEGIQHTKILTW